MTINKLSNNKGRFNLEYNSISDIDKVELRKGKRRVTRLSNTSGASIGIDTSHQQGKPPTSTKPTLPVKPLHIRPGLKPVKIPTVDDKILVRFIRGIINV